MGLDAEARKRIFMVDHHPEEFAGATEARSFVFTLLGEFAVEFLALLGEFEDFFVVMAETALRFESVEGSEGGL